MALSSHAITLRGQKMNITDKQTVKIDNNHFLHFSETAMNMFIVWFELHNQQFKVSQFSDRNDALRCFNKRKADWS